MLSGDQLRRIRLARGLSQKDISTATGINSRIIGAIERFEIEPSQEQHDKYVKAVYSLPEKELKNKTKKGKSETNE